MTLIQTLCCAALLAAVQGHATDLTIHASFTLPGAGAAAILNANVNTNLFSW